MRWLGILFLVAGCEASQPAQPEARDGGATADLVHHPRSDGGVACTLAAPQDCRLVLEGPNWCCPESALCGGSVGACEPCPSMRGLREHESGPGLCYNQICCPSGRSCAVSGPGQYFCN